MTRPPEELAPKIWRVPVPLPNVPGAEHLGLVNCYLLGGGDRWALVDTGMTTDEALVALEAGFQAAGLRWRDLDLVLITHHHPDHYGMSSRIREMTDAEVMIHRREVEVLYTAVWGGYTPGGMLAEHGGPKLDFPSTMFIQMPGFEPAPADQYLVDDQVIELGGRDLRVLHTPGHAPGHCCFEVRQESVVLTGDHILPKITPHVGLYPGGDENPLGDYLDSLKRIAEEGFRHAFPAHQEPFLDPATRVGRIVRHHEYRVLSIVDALGKDPRTAWEIVPEVFGELPQFHVFAALFETLAHLVLAEKQGKVAREESDGVVRWRRL